jgi:hypothetical protein
MKPHSEIIPLSPLGLFLIVLFMGGFTIDFDLNILCKEGFYYGFKII